MNTVTICSDNFSDAWVKLLEDIWNRGYVVKPRGTTTKELLAVKLHVEHMERNILVHPDRNLNYKFMLAEWLWIQAERNDVKTVAKYNSKIRNFSEDGQTFFGAYGPRLGRQMEDLRKMLAQDPNCRQAVATIYKSTTDAMAGTRDTPCTLSLQVLVRGKKLHGIVNMRSSDIWLGLPYDFFNFSQICIGMATDLGIGPGSLTFNLGSSHLYVENSFDAQEVMINRKMLDCVRSPRELERPYDTGWSDSINKFLDKVEAGPIEDYLPSPWCYYQRALEAKTWPEALIQLRSIGAV